MACSRQSSLVCITSRPRSIEDSDKDKGGRVGWSRTGVAVKVCMGKAKQGSATAAAESLD